jgi:hypothetical protein
MPEDVAFELKKMILSNQERKEDGKPGRLPKMQESIYEHPDYQGCSKS